MNIFMHKHLSVFKDSVSEVQLGGQRDILKKSWYLVSNCFYLPTGNKQEATSTDIIILKSVS